MFIGSLTVLEIGVFALAPHVQFFALGLSITINRIVVKRHPLLGGYDPLNGSNITVRVSADRYNAT